MRDRLSVSMRASHLIAIAFLVCALAFATVAAATGQSFYLRLGTEALIFAGLALSVDVLLGYTGALSLGQAVYFGIGAYASALALLWTPSFWLAMLAGGGAAFIASVLGGLVAGRVRGVYFALITFGFAQVFAKVVYNTRELGASDGLLGIPIVDINLGLISVSATSALGFFLVVLTIIFGLYAITAYLLNTPFGHVLMALKANERRVPFLGYSISKARMSAYVLAGVIAGLSGALYPMLRSFVSPELMFFATSGNAVISVVIGGTGTLIGGILGSVLLVVLRSFVGSWTEHHQVVIGMLFIISILVMPKGIAGLIRPAIERRLMRRRLGGGEVMKPGANPITEGPGR